MEQRAAAMTAPKILALVGPTASGKTGLSYLIANLLNEKINREPVIISADSRQIYKHISIAAAYPPREYLNKFKHYFIGELELNKEFNSGEYGKKAREIIAGLLAENKIPLIVGGSGLYIKSLVYGLFDYDEAVEAEGLKDKQKIIRQKLTERLHKEGIDNLLNELKKVDEISATRMTNVNQRRIIRALEVYFTTGIPISELQNRKIEIGFETAQFALNWERSELYERINKRVDEMLEQGLINEVQLLKEKGYSYIEFNSLNTVGVKEVFDYLSGLITYDKMVEFIKQNTRRFAKRQLTWFRKDKNIKWININDEKQLGNIANEIFNGFF